MAEMDINPNVSGRPKTLAEAKGWMLDRLRRRVHPMNAIDLTSGEAIIAELRGLDAGTWAQAWRAAGDASAAGARRAEASNDAGQACQLFLRASGLYFMGRFPCANHPDKKACAELERQAYLDAAKYWANPIERVAVPFEGRESEGAEVVFYYRRPSGIERPPAVVMWGGVDAWKEQMTQASDALLALGVATIAMDNAGTGESPLRGVRDAERQFLPVFDWAASRADLNARRVGCLGRSFGGYWATKLAHVYRERVAAAVNWGGGVHYMFQPEWVEASRYPDSYLMELVETRCRMLGARNDAEYIEMFARLSLLDQGVIDQPCAPLLLVNGKEDRQCPIDDFHLLLEHGSPKTVRFFPGGHMGITPATLPTICGWLANQLHGKTHA